MYHPRLRGNHYDMKDVFLVYDKSCFYEIVIAGICAGVDVLDHAGILRDVKSIHSSDVDFLVTLSKSTVVRRLLWIYGKNFIHKQRKNITLRM